MHIEARSVALAFFFLLALPATSPAEQVQDLTVHLSMSCPNGLDVCEVSPYEGAPGNPAGGHVNFHAIDLPWSYSFLTADPISWQCNSRCENYNANFGIGGMFLMNGPGGLTFSGQITSGKAWQNADITYGAELAFSGEWSNGLTATGNLLDQFTEWNGPYATLDVYTIPEPASLALLGGGILAVWGVRKRSSL